MGGKRREDSGGVVQGQTLGVRLNQQLVNLLTDNHLQYVCFRHGMELIGDKRAGTPFGTNSLSRDIRIAPRMAPRRPSCDLSAGWRGPRFLPIVDGAVKTIEQGRVKLSSTSLRAGLFTEIAEFQSSTDPLERSPIPTYVPDNRTPADKSYPIARWGSQSQGSLVDRLAAEAGCDRKCKHGRWRPSPWGSLATVGSSCLREPGDSTVMPG